MKAVAAPADARIWRRDLEVALDMSLLPEVDRGCSPILL
jgi:hypothetical protein